MIRGGWGDKFQLNSDKESDKNKEEKDETTR